MLLDFLSVLAHVRGSFASVGPHPTEFQSSKPCTKPKNDLYTLASYTHVVLLDEKKTLLGNHYCMGGSDLCCFERRFVVPRSCTNETVLCLKCVRQTVLLVELGRL